MSEKPCSPVEAKWLELLMDDPPIDGGVPAPAEFQDALASEIYAGDWSILPFLCHPSGEPLTRPMVRLLYRGAGGVLKGPLLPLPTGEAIVSTVASLQHALESDLVPTWVVSELIMGQQALMAREGPPNERGSASSGGA